MYEIEDEYLEPDNEEEDFLLKVSFSVKGNVDTRTLEGIVQEAIECNGHYLITINNIKLERD